MEKGLTIHSSLRVSLILVVLAATVVTGSAIGCAAARPRNVVVVVVDPLRPDWLGGQGGASSPTPILDAIAGQGTVADGLSPTSWSLPAMASLLTGLHPVQHTVTVPRAVLPPGCPTLAEMLGRLGFKSVAVTASRVIGSGSGLERGFAQVVEVQAAGGGGPASAEEVTRAALAAVADLSEPFFLLVHYAGEDASLAAAPASTAVGEAGAADPQVARDRSERDLRAVDGQVGELFEALEQRGLLKATLLVLTASHGEELGEHGHVGHGRTLHQEVTRVPLVFVAPGVVKAGRRIGTASLLDVVPTVLELVGPLRQQLPSALTGKSLATALSGRAESSGDDRAIVLHLDHESGHALAVVRGSRKLMVVAAPGGEGKVVSYDLASDPLEQRPLDDAAAGADDVALASLLADSLAELAGSRGAGAPQALTIGSFELVCGREAWLSPLVDLARTDVAVGSEGRPAYTVIGSSHVVADAGPPESAATPGQTSGAWLPPEVTSVFRVPPDVDGRYFLTAEGRTERPDRHRLTLYLNGTPVAELNDPPPGQPFALHTSRLGLRPGSLAVVSLVVTPPFDLGSASAYSSAGTVVTAVTLHDVTFPAHLKLGDPGVVGAQLSGFYGLEAGMAGRWTMPEASVVVDPPTVAEGGPSGLVIRVSGVCYRPDPHSVRLSLDGQPVGEPVNPRSNEPFVIEALAAAGADQRFVLAVVATPPYVPARLGLPDSRVLGAFLDEIEVRQVMLGSEIDLALAEANGGQAIGLHPREPGLTGQWTTPRFGATLAVPGSGPDEYQLVITGANYRPDAFTMRAYLDDRLVAELRNPLKNNPYEVTSDVLALNGGDVVALRIEVAPPFLPRAHGLADDREMGILVERIELRPAVPVSCVDFLGEGVKMAAVRGVYPAEEGLVGKGRWIEPEASIRVAAPETRKVFYNVVVDGINYRDAVTLVVRCKGGQVLSLSCPPGNFSVRAPIPLALSPAPGEAVVLDFAVTPPFRSIEPGFGERMLGLVFRRLCIE